jgi:hypothetical protein
MLMDYKIVIFLGGKESPRIDIAQNKQGNMALPNALFKYV